MTEDEPVVGLTSVAADMSIELKQLSAANVTRYYSITGSLLYLAPNTLLDICTQACVLSTYIASLTMSYMVAVK